MKMLVFIMIMLISFSGYSAKSGGNKRATKFICEVDSTDIKCEKKIGRPDPTNNGDNIFFLTIKGRKIIIDHKTVNHIELNDGTEVDMNAVLDAVKRSGSGTHGGG